MKRKTWYEKREVYVNNVKVFIIFYFIFYHNKLKAHQVKVIGVLCVRSSAVKNYSEPTVCFCLKFFLVFFT